MDAIRYWPCLRIGTSTAPSATGVGASSRLRGQIFQRQDLVAEQPLRLLDADLQVAHGGHLAQVDADRDERLGDFGRQAGDDHGGAEQARRLDRLHEVVRDVRVHRRHTGDVDHDHLRAVGADRAQQQHDADDLVRLDAPRDDALGKVARVRLQRLERPGLERFDVVVVHRRRLGKDLRFGHRREQLGPRDAPRPLLTQLRAILAQVGDELAQQCRNRTQLREEWARRITRAQLLTAMTEAEIFAEATSVYDNYVEALETGTFEALQAYARNLSERIIPRGVETHEVVGIVLLLRDVLARSLFAKYHGDFDKLNRILDAYEPAANRIANTVAVGFVQERERIIRQQQEAIRELSTPVLQVRERLLILPIIGVIDPQRARQLTEQLLRAIRTNRAKVVVIDITGVAAMDSNVANQLVQTVEASRLLGATVIVTGLSPEIAQTLVNIGVDLTKMNTVGDLQGGIEEAERLLGYKVLPVEKPEQTA